MSSNIGSQSVPTVSIQQALCKKKKSILIVYVFPSAFGQYVDVNKSLACTCLCTVYMGVSQERELLCWTSQVFPSHVSLGTHSPAPSAPEANNQTQTDKISTGRTRSWGRVYYSVLTLLYQNIQYGRVKKSGCLGYLVKSTYSQNVFSYSATSLFKSCCFWVFNSI